MSNTTIHHPSKEIKEIRAQLSYSKRIGLFLGAGCSKSLGISDISSLTKKVEKQLEAPYKTNYDSVSNDLDSLLEDGVNVENILNQVRLIRRITHDDKNRNYNGISGKEARELDIEICNKIYSILVQEQEKVDITPLRKFVSWLNWLNRDYSKDIFTTNYDLLLEKSFESSKIPFFDGFIGSDEPFFSPETLEDYQSKHSPPLSWIKLWKLHGSLGWFWKNGDSDKNSIVRLGSHGKELKDYEEIVIYPSREKYNSSRKQPFISYFDRLKTFLHSGEGLFIINGYSFSDDHLNSIIFDGIKHNNRLHVIGFFFTDKVLEKINETGNTFNNFSCYGPNKAIINGTLGKWKKKDSNNLIKQFWDSDEDFLTLGDFKKLIDFFLIASGAQKNISSNVSENE